MRTCHEVFEEVYSNASFFNKNTVTEKAMKQYAKEALEEVLEMEREAGVYFVTNRILNLINELK